MEKKKKAGVYIDGSNIYHDGMKAGWQVDYYKLKQFIKRKYEIITIKYYNSIGYEKDRAGKYLKDRGGKHIISQATQKFENALQKMGYEVISKPLKFIKGKESIASNKLDGDLMIDALLEHQQWDELILLSGDSDFERLVKEISKMEKNVLIFSFDSRMAHELRMLSLKLDKVSYIKLDKLKQALWRQKPTAN